MTFRASSDPEDLDGPKVNHASDCGTGGEFTACGMSVDEWPLDHIKNVDQNITCDQCILYIEQTFNQFEKVKGKWRQK